MNKHITYFTREHFLTRLKEETIWDIIVIGGGATGLGTALDAAARGFKTLLLEQSDFAKGTSSRSTKLVHGGVRYLEQGNISLVLEGLKERGRLLSNAPHLIKKQAFIIPCYGIFSILKYTIGLKLYDWLAGKLSFGHSKYIGKRRLKSLIPGLNSGNLKGGIEYFDGQFDDSRLAINIAQTCAEQGGVLLNYVRVKGLLKSADGKVDGVIAQDLENHQEYKLKSRAVVNATGVFADDILEMDNPSAKPLIRGSQGVHVVIDRSFWKGDHALLIPKTSDGRVLFAVPWYDKVLLGTTDTPLPNHSLEPVALKEEIDFIIRTVEKYLSVPPSRKDILSVFAGLRPLAASADDSPKTKEISRSHKLHVSKSGLVTIMGGKWTTYRKMAEDTIDKTIKVSGLGKVACNTFHLKIHGFSDPSGQSALGIYGSDKAHIEDLVDSDPALSELLHPQMSYILGEVVWAVRNEMARTVEDVLARRLRVLFLNARIALEMAPRVAAIIASELKYDERWVKDQISGFSALARQYLPDMYFNKSDEPLKIQVND